ncbi:hypothetical protein BT96DRAFT_1009205 [Gymnopus androsaceus JB14]|uniref:Uncharacterized protein n=1 Tax=Gymnopus androsaceus JB14 TaxID=1447944 RepID=A0A6A4GD15_9AGAR|nr:hypothetical protein BT96DRAFT_1009205 [Gymnopus androsaceus JB14]
MMMERRLPNELVDCILENLYLNRDTLLNCALVGKPGFALRSVASSEKSFSSCHHRYVEQHLDALFAEKPYLASYVRSLELERFLTQTEYDNEQVTMPGEVVYTVTASLVRRLSNLDDLSFFFVDWEGVPPLLQAALTEIYKAPSLTQFHANYVYTPHSQN